MSTVSIGDFLADTDDTSRVTVNVEGWTDAPPVADGVTDRAQQNGGWDGTGYFRPRVISLDGLVDVASHAEAMALADALTAISPQSTQVFTVDDADAGSRQAVVRVTSGAVISWVSAECFTYSIQLKAPDPLKYGPQTFAQTSLSGTAAGTGRVWPRVWPRDWGVPAGVTPGAVSLSNAGSASYWPRLRIDGPVPNPTVTLVETGDSVHFDGTVAAGQWLDFDLANRRVLLNGQVSVRSQVSSSGAWLAVPPGGGSVSWTADAADPAASLSVWGYEGAWY